MATSMDVGRFILHHFGQMHVRKLHCLIMIINLAYTRKTGTPMFRDSVSFDVPDFKKVSCGKIIATKGKNKGKLVKKKTPRIKLPAGAIRSLNFPRFPKFTMLQKIHGDKVLLENKDDIPIKFRTFGEAELTPVERKWIQLVCQAEKSSLIPLLGRKVAAYGKEIFQKCLPDYTLEKIATKKKIKRKQDRKNRIAVKKYYAERARLKALRKAAKELEKKNGKASPPHFPKEPRMVRSSQRKIHR